MNTIQIQRKADLIRYFLAECRAHSEMFGEPCPLKILSAKYGRAMNAVGGFREIVQELQIDGTIALLRKQTGGQSVLLGGVTSFEVTTKKVG